MRFVPKTDQELNSLSLIQPGIYNFEILEALDTISRAGNEMIKLKLKVWTHDGSERIIFDYILPNFPFKLKCFAQTCGLLDKYELGNIEANDCLSKLGKLEIEIEKGKSIIKDNGEHINYPDRNTVKNYMIKKELSTKEIVHELDDDLPF